MAELQLRSFVLCTSQESVLPTLNDVAINARVRVLHRDLPLKHVDLENPPRTVTRIDSGKRFLCLHQYNILDDIKIWTVQDTEDI